MGTSFFNAGEDVPIYSVCHVRDVAYILFREFDKKYIKYFEYLLK